MTKHGEMQRAKLMKVTHVCCPRCNQRSGSIDHLGVGQQTTWLCDFCRFYYRLENRDGEWWVEPTQDSAPETIDAVRVDNTDVVLFVRGMCFEGPRFDDGRNDNPEYYYEEHSCPAGVFRKTLHALIDGDLDNHGALKFLGRRRLAELEEVEEEDRGHWLYRWAKQGSQGGQP